MERRFLEENSMEWFLLRYATLWRSSAPVLLVSFAAVTAALPALARSCPPPGLSIDRPLETSQGSAAWQYVAVRAGGLQQCPQPAAVPGVRWQVDALFKDATEQSQRGVPAALLPYCVYKARGASGAQAAAVREALEDLVDDGTLLGATASAAAVQRAAELPVEKATGSSAWQPWREHFLDQAEALRGRAGEPALEPRFPVRLAVLDTQPVDENGRCVSEPNSHHGLSLIELAGRLVCPGDAGGGRCGERNGRCAAAVSAELALQISEFDWADETKTRFDYVKGGFYGTLEMLAQAIWKAVRDRGEQKLILNLSVAWLGERWGGLESRPEEMPKSVAAVYEALRLASCEDVLVVAAAGNRLGGPETEHGPLLPAGWERHPAPDEATCARLEHGRDGEAAAASRANPGRAAPGRAASPEAPRPLLYAVSGISSDGDRLANARPGSEPARVAHADHAVAYANPGSSPPKILTGSSVSAVVASAAAAMVWSHAAMDGRAIEDPHKVMDLVASSGRELGRTAQFHVEGGRADTVRRLGVCPALRQAHGGGRCDPPSARPPRYPGLDCDGPRLGLTRLRASRQLDPFCGISTLHYDPDVGAPQHPCPFRQFFGIRNRPWSGPQPQENPCSGCDIQPPPDYGNGDVPPGEAVLRIAIDTTWKGGRLSPVIFAAGDEAYALADGDGLLSLAAGECAVVERIDRNHISGPIRLHFLTADGVSIESPVMVGGFPLEERQ